MSKNVVVDGKELYLGIWDVTGGRMGYANDRLRPLQYPQTDVFLLCFAIDNKESLENLKIKWLPEITQHCPGIPWILVGNKSDLRRNNNNNNKTPNGSQSQSEESSLITQDDAKAFANELKAQQYIECSAMLKQNVEHVFQESIQYVI